LLIPRRWKLAAVMLVALFGLVALFAVDPAGSFFFPRCPFHALTGLHCPGCGTLRALHQLLHGNPGTAFWLNPLMVASLPLIAYSFLSGLVRVVSGWKVPVSFLPAVWIWILLGVIILFWIARNIPLYPFSLLAP
jgi:hypothetical protein